MNITHVIATKFPVSGYGGTERVAYWLGKAQAELGHKVTYVAHADSHLPFADCTELPEDKAAIYKAVPKNTDIVQLYNTPDFALDYPLLINIGGNGQAGEKFHPNTVFVSRNHAERHHWTEYVHNGLDLSEYPLKKNKEKFSLFLAKASWSVKNLKGAVRIARAANSELYVAGGSARKWQFGIRNFGTVDGAAKIDLLQRASLLLFPIIWDEPFGLVAIETLACGTPVIATANGALPEIVDESCGKLCNSFDGFVTAVQSIVDRKLQFSPEICRARVEEKFSHIKMAEKYLQYYKQVQSTGRLRSGEPFAAPDADPQRKIYYKGYRPRLKWWPW